MPAAARGTESLRVGLAMPSQANTDCYVCLIPCLRVCQWAVQRHATHSNHETLCTEEPLTHLHLPGGCSLTLACSAVGVMRMCDGVPYVGTKAKDQ